MSRENDNLQHVLLAAESAADAAPRVSSRLQSRIFSKLVELEQEQGPLRTLSQSQSAGAKLCALSTPSRSRRCCISARAPADCGRTSPRAPL